MNRKSLIWLFVAIFSTLGGFIPNLWGAGFLSFSSIILTMIGGLFGIWFAFKITG